jgi:CubicO group peptidase (beta-lactamase class C family)
MAAKIGILGHLEKWCFELGASSACASKKDCPKKLFHPRYFPYFHSMKLKLFLLTVLPLVFLSACTVGRMVVHQFSDIKDYKRFPSRPLPQVGTPFQFTAPSAPELIAQKHVQLNYRGRAVPLDSVLAATNTVAFLIIRNDTLLHERYFDGYAQDSWVASFSMAKSYTSALIGIAIAEGKIRSVDDLMSDYLPEMKDSKLADVTLKQLLEMSANIHHAENYFNPFAGVARLYYGKHLQKQLRPLRHEAPGGSKWTYQSICTQYLGEVLVRATGRSMTDYMLEKLWGPLGMESPASWSIDQRRDGREKAFCCINATARDFAKFGRLYLHGGNWNGRQLVPAEWVAASTAVRSDRAKHYGYQWWLFNGDYAAEGHLGQFIYVSPQNQTILVRLGKNYGNFNWNAAFKEILAQLAAA